MTYSSPQTLYEALAIVRDQTEIGKEQSVRFIGGGTDLIPRQTVGSANDSLQQLIDVAQIDSLRKVELSDDNQHMMIGAAVRVADLAAHPLIVERFPHLAQAALSIASPGIRASATVGGNLLCENRCIYFDQSEFWREATGGCLKSGSEVCVATGSTKHCYSIFVSDLTPVLICLDAEVELFDQNGSRWLAIADLYSGDGLESHRIPKNVLLAHVRIPHANEGKMYFQKIRPRESVDFTSLTLAMRVDDRVVHIAASGVGPAPVSIVQERPVEAAVLSGLLFSKTKIIDNGAYQRDYRKQMVHTTIAQGLVTLV